MSVEIIYDHDREKAVLTCNTTDTAFGPVFSEIDKNHGWTAGEVAENFLRWLPQDARRYRERELEDLLGRFIAAEPLECHNSGCEQPATRYDYSGLGNRAYDRDTPFCSEECRDAYEEDHAERDLNAYYGASTPQTEAERGAIAAAEKEKLG